MATFQPPPTYALPILVEETTDAKGERHTTTKFAPVWLKWFLDLAQVLSASGASGGTIVHNDTSSKQGGSASEFYHLTAAEYAALAAGSSSGVLANRSFRQAEFIRPVQWDETQNMLANQIFGG